MGNSRSTIQQVLLRAGLGVLAGLTLLPLAITVVFSQKSNGEILNHFWALPERFRPEHFSQAWEALYPYMLNSIIVCAIAVVGVVVLASLSGYVFARIDFSGKPTFFMLLLALMMIPGLLTLIPAFLWYKQFPFIGGNDWTGAGGTGFLDSWWVLIIPWLTGGQVFGVYLCRTFFESIPSTLFEAARIDGAGELRAWLHIAMPLSLPILATLAIMNFVGTYNDYVWPLITIGNNTRQVFAVGITKFGSDANLDWGPIMAGYLIGAAPLILIFTFGMKYYVEGLTQGAVKG